MAVRGWPPGARAGRSASCAAPSSTGSPTSLTGARPPSSGPAITGDHRRTLARVAALTRRLFGVGYTLRGVSYPLHRIGWTPQVASHLPRAVGVAFSIDRAAQLGFALPWVAEPVKWSV